jgi:hypothetical protein
VGFDVEEYGGVVPDGGGKGAFVRVGFVGVLAWYVFGVAGGLATAFEGDDAGGGGDGVGWGGGGWGREGGTLGLRERVCVKARECERAEMPVFQVQSREIEKERVCVKARECERAEMPVSQVQSSKG